jgi:hypothetical protein
MTGVLVGFDSPQAFDHALERLTAARVPGIETYTPMPPSDAPAGARPQDSPTGGHLLGESPLPLAMFIAGIVGFGGFFWLMRYADVAAYPIDVGGRPPFAWPTFVPIAFELGVLCAMVVGFAGFFVLCRMPQPYDPVDECAGMRRASRDAWLVAIRSTDPRLIAEVRRLLEPLAPASFEEIPT